MIPVSLTLAILALFLLLSTTHAQNPVPTTPLLSLGCSPATRLKSSRSKSNSGSHIISSLAGRGSRPFILDLPNAYSPSKPRPLILAFHDINQSAMHFKEVTQFSSLTSEEYILAYPAGMSGRWTGEPTAPLTSKINDVGFAGDLIRQLTGEFCVDVSRIYAVGFGNGGGLVDMIACDPWTSGKLAAVAIVGGAFYEKAMLKDLGRQGGGCKPSHVMPMLEMHGEKDTVAKYQGRKGSMLSVPVWLAGWARRAGCTREEAGQNDSDLLFGGRVGRWAWTCNRGLRNWKEVVVHYWLKGLGHEWVKEKVEDGNGSGEGVSKGGGEGDFDATRAILEFLGNWRLEDILEGKEEVKDEL